jgi:hypothetical protein
MSLNDKSLISEEPPLKMTSRIEDAAGDDEDEPWVMPSSISGAR